MQPSLLAELNPWFLCLVGCGAAAAASVAYWRSRRGRRDGAVAGELAKMIEAIRENSDATDAVRERVDRVSEDVRRLRRDLGGEHWSRRSKEP